MAERPHRSRWLLAWLTVLAAVFAFVLGGVAPAAADEGEIPPAPESGESNNRWTNGCTAMPDGVFTIACNEHDLCYGGFIADPNNPSRAASRQFCDATFYVAMSWSCVGAYGWFDASLPYCFAVAGAYYVGVRSFGGYYYDPEYACREWSTCWF